MSTPVEPLRVVLDLDCEPAHAFEHDWGQITLWQPPERLGYAWHPLIDRSVATEVEIGFRPHGSGTRIEIEHRGWERLGTDAEVLRARNHGGWSTLLPHYVEAVAQTVHEERRSR